MLPTSRDAMVKEKSMGLPQLEVILSTTSLVRRQSREVSDDGDVREQDEIEGV